MAVSELTNRGRTRLWHPFADMNAVAADPFVIERADGVWLYDVHGAKYLDATAGLWYCNVGHNRQEIIEAVSFQMRKLDVYHAFGDVTNPPAELLASRLSELSPMKNSKVFLTSGGGDAIDTAVKLARLYWVHQGQPGRTHILTRSGSFHGTHGLGTSIGGIEMNREGFGPLMPDSSRVSPNDLGELNSTIDRIGPDKIAAFFIEPVLGAGGVYPPEPGYLETVADLCANHGILLVCDSVIGAFGRLGDWFGVERWHLMPDMIVFAKGVSSGYLPLGGLVINERVAEPFWNHPERPFRHGPTYSGHPTVAAAALANLGILERDNLLARSRELEPILFGALKKVEGHPAVKEVRGGVGLLGAIELDQKVLSGDPSLIVRLFREIRKRGVLVRPLASSLAVSPPLIVTPQEIELIVDAIRSGLESTI